MKAIWAPQLNPAVGVNSNISVGVAGRWVGEGGRGRDEETGRWWWWWWGESSGGSCQGCSWRKSSGVKEPGRGGDKEEGLEGKQRDEEVTAGRKMRRWGL